MSPLTIAIVLALAATLYSLVCGISSMAVNGEVRHQNSEKWMFRRIGFQAATVALLLAAMALE